jgi:hypothetical protein
MPSTRRRAVLASAGTALTAVLAGCATGTVTREFEDSYAVEAGPLTVANDNGDVTVQPAAGPELTVAGTKRAGSSAGLAEVAVDVATEDGAAVTVSTDPGWFGRQSASLTVLTPERLAVERVDTANGDVTVQGVGGDVTAVTSNGRVELVDIEGAVRAETSNGDVRVRETTGLRGVRTSNGEVDAELFAIDGDVSCESSNGRVTVRVGPDVAADFDLSTSNGEAVVENVPHTVTASGDDELRGRLRGGGEDTLTLSSSNGDVRIRPAER